MKKGAISLIHSYFNFMPSRKENIFKIFSPIKKVKISTKYTYDAQSNILSFTDGEGIENTYNYAGNVISSTEGS